MGWRVERTAVVASGGVAVREGWTEPLPRVTELLTHRPLLATCSPDRNKAAVGGATADVAAAGSKTKILVLPTDEELSIAQQTKDATGL